MKLIHHDVFREIKKSSGRFISLFLIIALGVAFYAGIRSCNPDMLISADTYYDEANLMDIRVMSSLRLTNDDIDAIKEIDGISDIKGTYTTDMLSQVGDSRQAVKVMAYNDEINIAKIQKGRNIESDDECLVDDYYLNFRDYQLGDEIELFTSQDDSDDIINKKSFKIVGSFTSAEYLSFDLGNTKVGSGKLDGLLIVSPDVFDIDYYTQIDITVSGAKELMCYSDEYDDLVDKIKDRIKDTGKVRALERYNEIYDEAQKEIEDARSELYEKSKEYDNGKKEYDEQKKQLDDRIKETLDMADLMGLNAEQKDLMLKEFDDAKEQLKDANKELKDAKEELDDAREQIEDAENELFKIEKNDWYVLDRMYLTEYSSYRSDADRIGNVGKVFPVIFFIVAALVCLTTMTRMVDEERTQIGTLKALGYSKITIMRKYILYALFATVLGSFFGALIGSKVLPYVILNVYKLMYPNLAILLFPYSIKHCLTASLAALVCILAATFFACTKSLSENPANLMRPVSPKPGRKLLIERIKPLWRRIPFTWKNALRNFVRYKKRLFMTLFGIIGSTALLLVGFGLKDSVNTILYTQFGDINKYNEVISIDEDATQEARIKLEEHVAKDDRFLLYHYADQSATDVSSKNSRKILDAYILVPEDIGHIDDLYDLRNRVTGQKLKMDKDSVLISEKMAKLLNVKEGDKIIISEEQKDEKEITVGGIIENYLYHYIFMDPSLYEKLYGNEPDYNEIIIVNKENIAISSDEFGHEYMQEDAVAGSMCIDEMKDKFADMLKSMDSITLVLIICAGALTFIVLFNLNNINISERRRELATLKVLGFYDKELSQYIYRENILITIIGVAAGILAGIYLNRFVVTTVEVDIVMFGRQILLPSFILSIIIAIGFTAIVNIVIHFKMKKIDMATSLKSVE